jgi:hypothetical protein
VSELSRKKAIIKRAQQAAIAGYFTLDLKALEYLEQAYQGALEEILALIKFYGDSDQIIRLEQLSVVRRDVENVLTNLATIQSSSLNANLTSASRLGAGVFISDLGSETLEDLVSRSTRFVQHFTAKDGLQLSDRLWIINDSNQQRIIQAINSAVIQGKSASEAAADLIANGENPSRQILDKLRRPSTNNISNTLKAQFFDEDAAYWQARRLFRTEINRAYGISFQNGLEGDDDVAGTKFKLSPRHPRKDICDMHATVNRYGLGKGVYPKGKNPWPAHPNTLSYVETVFTDEVTDQDREGKEDRINWLAKQNGATRIGVLGAYKNRLLANQQLKENMINTRVIDLRKKFGDA